jgi:hypothetical protein
MFLLSKHRVLLVVLSSALLGAASWGADVTPESLTASGGFEQGGDVPAGWTPRGWSRPADAPAVAVGISEVAPVAGRRALKLPATTVGGAGVVSPSLPLPTCTTRFRVSLRVSADYRGNEPWVFLQAFSATGAYLGQIDVVRLPLHPGTTWRECEFRVRPEQAPVGTQHLVLALATRFTGNGPVAGEVCYDSVSVDALPGEFQLAGADFGNWTIFGKPVVVRAPAGLPPEVTALSGVVRDDRGTEIASVSAPRAEVLASGWTWQPSEPGWYEVAFSATLVDGRTVPHSESYIARAATAEGATQVFSRERMAVAVVRTPPKPMAQRPPLLGFSAGFGADPADLDALHCADVMGASFIRWHIFSWGWSWDKSEVQPAKGVFNWQPSDARLAAMRKYGFDVFADIYGTPAWASPHPERTELTICVPAYTAYAPTDLNDFTTFVRAAVGRYGADVRGWELWNEPHLPGGSVFWNDTPERFVALLQAGYQAVKEVRPEAEVWIGGMGMRYLPFYKELLRLGGGPYFDRLALHGTWCDPQPFQALEQSAGVTHRPWVDSEFHGVLIGADRETLPSEAAIARRAVLDFLFQVRRGAERIAFFEARNLGEMESLRYSGQIVDGLFRRRPRLEPRLAAVVLQHVWSLIDRDFSITGEYLLPGGQRAVACRSGGRSHLIIWADDATPVALDQRLASAIAGGTLRDGAGRTWTGPQLMPDDLLIAEDVPQAASLLADCQGTALVNDRQQRVASGGITEARAQVAPAPARWIESGWGFKGIAGAPRPADFTARFQAQSTTAGLALTIEVHDAVDRIHDVPGDYWQGDSVQLAIDTGGAGILGDQTTFQLAATATGAVLWKERAVYVGGDLPAGWTPAKRAVSTAQVTVGAPAAGVKRYALLLPWSELYPYRFAADTPLRLSLLVNNDNGSGRFGWLEWGGGIGQDYDPALYGKLIWEAP